MSEPFLGSLTPVGFTFPPRGYADCSGDLLFISQNSALFSLLGTMYGGDGRTTFGLPDLRGRAPVGVGPGPGLGPVTQGEMLGQETVTLSTNQIPAHVHAYEAADEPGDDNDPGGARLAEGRGFGAFSTDAPDTALRTTSSAGGGQSHNNMMPSLVIRWVIATVGTYPSRN